MAEETKVVATSLDYTHILGLSVKLQGTTPKSINGLSPLALVRIVYPNEEYEEVVLDLSARQYHLSHGYTIKLNDIDIGTSYLPWVKMFTGAVSLTAIEDIQPTEKLYPQIPGVTDIGNNIDANYNLAQTLNTDGINYINNLKRSGVKGELVALNPGVLDNSGIGLEVGRGWGNGGLLMAGIFALSLVTLGLIGFGMWLNRRGD